MDFKKELKKHFGDSKTLMEIRYNISKNVFIFFSLLFFLNYLFVGAKFYDYIFLITLPFLYICFLLTFCFIVFYYLKYTFNLNNIIGTIIAILLLAVFTILLYPFSGIIL
ncbi:MAG: hypothetical protein PHE25_01350 [Candidatus Gracilibacteria bacterium]|nr:hypothetical protein [Candidatus Gracilibacteria bacterium]